MLKCVICSFYSHGESYDNNDPKCSHVCVKCVHLKRGRFALVRRFSKIQTRTEEIGFWTHARNLQMSTTIINWWLVRLIFGLPELNTSSKLEQQNQFRVVAAILKLNGFSKSKNKKMSKQHLRICKSLDVKNSWQPQFLIKFP